jgi:hypothetical protein
MYMYIASKVTSATESDARESDEGVDVGTGTLTEIFGVGCVGVTCPWPAGHRKSPKVAPPAPRNNISPSTDYIHQHTRTRRRTKSQLGRINNQNSKHASIELPYLVLRNSDF